MRLGAYQFTGSGDIQRNFQKITSGIQQAARQQVRFLIFHECALTGYPPLEVALDDIDFTAVDNDLGEIARLAAASHMYIAVGSVTRRNGATYNSILTFTPEGEMLAPYDKRALWGWDRDNFTEGTNSSGVYPIDDLHIGIRICFEVRFPEFFRELYRAKADLCAVSFCDVSQTENLWRYNLITSHLQTRAVENVMPVLSVNDTAFFQTAPTAAIDNCGEVEACLTRGAEGLLVYDFEPQEPQFGQLGRMFINERLVKS